VFLVISEWCMLVAGMLLQVMIVLGGVTPAEDLMDVYMYK
jgi:hypothetical protein